MTLFTTPIFDFALLYQIPLKEYQLYSNEMCWYCLKAYLFHSFKTEKVLVYFLLSIRHVQPDNKVVLSR